MEIFPDDTLVKQAFVPSAVPGGQVDISLTTLDSWAGRIPQVSIAASPLWTLTMEDSRKALAWAGLTAGAYDWPAVFVLLVIVLGFVALKLA